jgi:hypothetical protein
MATEDVEAQCQALARSKKFIREQDAAAYVSEQPVAGQYVFLHLLYHQAIYERVTPFRRAKLHSVLDPLLVQSSDYPRQERKSKMASQLQRDAEMEADNDGG